MIKVFNHWNKKAEQLYRDHIKQSLSVHEEPDLPDTFCDSVDIEEFTDDDVPYNFIRDGLEGWGVTDQQICEMVELLYSWYKPDMTAHLKDVYDDVQDEMEYRNNPNAYYGVPAR